MEQVTVSAFSARHAEAVKDLLVELQTFLAGLDPNGVLVLRPEYREGYFRFVSDEIAARGGEIFVAECGGEVVGCIVCKLVQGGGEAAFTTTCPKVGFISDLVVAAPSRGKGIGKKLLSAAESYFRGQACEYVQLEVFAPNAQAAALYRQSGYAVNSLFLSKKI